MGIKLKNVSINDLKSFDSVVGPVIKHIKENWETDSIKPKDYDKQEENFDIFEHIEELEKNFTGMIDERVCSFSLPVALHKSSVKHSDEDQGRTPFETLISTCIGYGMVIEAHRKQQELNIKVRKHDEHVKTMVRASITDLQSNTGIDRKEIEKHIQAKYFLTDKYTFKFDN
jgi:hypothetical protein